MGLGHNLYLFRRTLILVLTPLFLLPLLVFSPADFFSEAACGYSILLMAVYWVSEVVPLAVTALLPLVLYPFLGVLPAKEVSVQYLKDVNILFLGGLTVAVAVEQWNLHKRIALKVLTFVGTEAKWLLFGFMSTTAFLSMWISNVATTAMMIPIAQAVLEEMNMENNRTDSDSSSTNNTPENKISAGGMEVPKIHIVPGMDDDTPAQGNHISENDWDRPVNFQEDTVRYSKGAYYSPVSGAERNKARDEENHNQLEIADSDGPDNSRTQLVSSDEFQTSQERLRDIANKEQNRKGMCKALTICICYAANIGGTATLTGTGPNLIMAGQFKSAYKDAPEVDFGSWVMFAFPGMLVFLLFAWIWLQYLFLNLTVRQIFTCCKKRERTMEEIKAEQVIHRQYEALGPMCFAEVVVLILFIILALLWLTRDPGFISGWGNLPIFKGGYITDATVAMFIAFLLFVLPSRRPNILCCRNTGEEGPVPPLLTWKILQEKMSWNVIILLGGSFAMALGSKESGLSDWIGTKLQPLNGIHPLAVSLICCCTICALTQCTSNTATATVFIPILAELAEILRVNPMFLLLPATVITSYAFMLPVSTPPNAIAYSYGHLKMKDMIKAGFVLNIFGVFIAVTSVYAMGGPSFHVFEPCPDWLHSPHCEQWRFNASLMINSTIPLHVTLPT